MADHRYVVNIEGVITADGRYLMIVRGAAEAHAPGTLSFPGGTVDQGEVGDNILEETLRREIAEEVGVRVENEFVYVESHAFVADDGEPCVDVVFLCRLRAGEVPVAGSADEVAGLRWMTADEILVDPLAPPWTKQSISLAERRRAEVGW